MGTGGPGAGMGSLGPPMGTGGFLPGGKKDDNFNIFNLKNASAVDLEPIIKKLFPNTEMASDPRTNALIVRADRDTLDKIGMLIARLDLEPSKRK
jgi:hypothetical protein